MNGITAKRIKDTIFVPLPAEVRKAIQGGCECSYCKAHPNETPTWDTLAIDVKCHYPTWTVHFPDLYQRRTDGTRA